MIVILIRRKHGCVAAYSNSSTVLFPGRRPRDSACGILQAEVERPAVLLAAVRNRVSGRQVMGLLKSGYLL